MVQPTKRLRLQQEKQRMEYTQRKLEKIELAKDEKAETEKESTHLHARTRTHRHTHTGTHTQAHTQLHRFPKTHAMLNRGEDTKLKEEKKAPFKKKPKRRKNKKHPYT